MTPWAYIVYALLVVGVIFFSLYAVQRRERNRFKIRQIEEDAKKREELSQMKFRFFTNVSHDLRTPLTLIISPMESMMKEIYGRKTAWQATTDVPQCAAFVESGQPVARFP